jgi:Uma2 family endonuclease
MATNRTELATPQRRRATYEDVLAAPEDRIAEIIAGELYLQPRPAPRHSSAAFGLAGCLDGPFNRGVSGPGGWIILFGPELHIEEDVLVPDLAGWRTARMPVTPEGAFIDLVPDWACEILSTSTRAKDIGPKRETYARIGLGHLWHVDPSAQTLETFVLEDGRWVVGPTFRAAEPVRAAPFAEIAFPLDALWPGRAPSQAPAT